MHFYITKDFKKCIKTMKIIRKQPLKICDDFLRFKKNI